MSAGGASVAAGSLNSDFGDDGEEYDQDMYASLKRNPFVEEFDQLL